MDVGERNQDAAPYEPEDTAKARAQMKALEGESVGPSELEGWMMSWGTLIIRR